MEMRQSARVVIADDHPFYRRSLAGALRDAGVDVVREVADGAAAYRAVTESTPDVLVLDLEMPGTSGLEATRLVVEGAPATRVLVMSVSAQATEVAATMRAGADGYVLKDERLDEIIAAIRAIAGGRRFLSSRVADELRAARSLQRRCSRR
jgi:DNA-binding NarL/FixJ family response regulator